MKLTLLFVIFFTATLQLSLAPKNSFQNELKQSCKNDDDCQKPVLPKNNKQKHIPSICVRDSQELQKYCVQGLAPPPPTLLLNAVSLGRPQAAADLLWIRTMQFIGTAYSELVEYHGIEHWIEAITDLKADAHDAPQFVGILMSTFPARATVADQLLLKAEQMQAPEERTWNISFWRAAIQYYSLRNIKRAAELYQQSANYDDAPDWIGKRAVSILKQKNSCDQVKASLLQTFQVANQDSNAPQMTQKRAQKSFYQILENCYEAAIEQAEAAYLLTKKKRALNIQELLDSHYLEEQPIAPPGLQWKLIKRKAELVPLEKNSPD